jgi:2-oxoglutarate dehydrogenase E2 component (dihydrolipoamide succinyltransferase)
MALDIKIPAVGESISEVTISKWNKKDGESVQMDEVLCELESDKATFELNAPAAGVLHIVVQEGETIAIDTLIARIDESNGASGGTQPAKTEAEKNTSAPTDEPKATAFADERPQTYAVDKEPAKTTASASGQVVEMKVPTVGESITEVTIGTWHKNDGDQVQLNDLLCEIESDKATFELTAEQAGTLRIVAAAGTTLPIGGLICKIEVTADGSQPVTQPTTTPTQPVQATQPQTSGGQTYATGTPSPSAQKILAEKGIKPEEVKGSGIDGRITKNDAVTAQKPATTQPAVTKPVETAKPEAKQPVQAGERAEKREKMTSLRKTVARRLVAVKNETAMLTTFNEVDMKPIMDLRARYKDKFKEKHSVGLGFMSFFTKACCVALQEWPAVNAMIDGDEIVYHHYADISIAVSSPRGLVVPIIRNAEQMSFAGIEAEIVRLAGKAKENKLTIEDMTGGTFTITNGGIFGSMLSTPIINAPQTAILGMHNIVERPVVVDGQIVIRPIMYVALSYDHRIIDGREAVSFLVRVKQLLEDPTRLLLEV